VPPAHPARPSVPLRRVCSTLTAGHKIIFGALGLPQPARSFDFTATSD
jgi:hypothetical protein